jgi:hypothetical protein
MSVDSEIQNLKKKIDDYETNLNNVINDKHLNTAVGTPPQYPSPVARVPSPAATTGGTPPQDPSEGKWTRSGIVATAGLAAAAGLTLAAAVKNGKLPTGLLGGSIPPLEDLNKLLDKHENKINEFIV